MKTQMPKTPIKSHQSHFRIPSADQYRNLEATAYRRKLHCQIGHINCVSCNQCLKGMKSKSHVTIC